MRSWCVNAQCCGYNLQKQQTKIEMQMGLKLFPLSIHFIYYAMWICFNFPNCDSKFCNEIFVVPNGLVTFSCIFERLSKLERFKKYISLCFVFFKVCECWKVEQCAKFVFCQNCRFVFPNLLGDGPWVLLKSKKLLSHVLFWICYLLGWNCYKCFMGFKLWICVVWESPSSFNMAQNLSTSKIVCCHNISFLVVM